jgi:hypothetical protein
MKKAIVVVLALAIIWAVPGVRQRIGVALLPVFERLGPVGERVANPVRAFQARNDLSFFLRMMEEDATEGRPRPDPRRFSEWVDQRMPEESGVDPWGQPYWMRQRDRTVTVGSNGVDMVRDTDDDILQEATLQR